MMKGVIFYKNLGVSVPIQFLFLTDDYKLHASIALYFADPQISFIPVGDGLSFNQKRS